jgi:hypothetical protein
MSSNEYFLAWTIYIGASFFVLMFWCWITSPVKWVTFRLVLRFPVLALLLAPVSHVANSSLLVPAIASAAFHFIAKDYNAASSDIMVLLGAVLASIAAALALGFIGHLIARLIAKYSPAQ